MTTKLNYLLVTTSPKSGLWTSLNQKYTELSLESRVDYLRESIERETRRTKEGKKEETRKGTDEEKSKVKKKKKGKRKKKNIGGRKAVGDL